MRIAYLVTAYPEVSHTFIRREILELERLGNFVARISIRSPTSRLVDPRDQAELTLTHYIVDSPAPVLIATLRVLALRPLRFAQALSRTIRMAGRSDRGLFRHFAYLAEACRVLEILEQEGIEHLHVHFGTNSATVGLLTRELGGPPWSFTAHGPDEFDAPVALSLRDKVASARDVVAVSTFGAAQLMRWSDPTDWGRILTVRCTVGSDFDGGVQPIDPASKTFVTVGRLSAQKGQLLLLEAFAALLQQGESALLVIVGDGELRARIEARIAALGIGESVRVTGWMRGDEVRAQLLACRALVMASFAEGLPVAIMEAFAAGRPVIATHISGIPELVEPGRSGWLVPAGDRHGLTEAMREALAAPTHALDEMAKRGASRVKERHDTAREVSVLLERWANAPGARS